MIWPAWQASHPRLVLASASSARRAILEEVGLKVEVCPSPLDETIAKKAADLEGWSNASLASRLACDKAVLVSRVRPGCLVIGADQVLSSDSRRFDKPGSLQEARLQLIRLRGTEHILYTAVAMALDEIVVWDHLSTPRLTMRRFSDALLDLYVSSEGEALLSCVGACRIEGLGQLLFDQIEGDRSTVLGLPILPLLRELRRRGVLLN